MEQFISIIIFTTPGLLVYFWIQAFGLNPVVKHTPTELTAVVALFWLPTVALIIATYDILYLIIDFFLNILAINISFIDMPFIKNLTDIQKSATSIQFILTFFVLSIFFSLLVGFFWIKLYDKYLLNLINSHRLKRKLTKLSDTTAVWDSFFHKLKTDSEEHLVVEIYKIDKSEEKIVGSVTKMSRPYETERSLVLDHTSEWMESIKKYNYKKERSYVDTKTGMVVTELNISIFEAINKDATS